MGVRVVTQTQRLNLDKHANVSHERIVFVGLLSFFVLTTISGAITTFTAQSLVVYARFFAGAVLFLCIGFLFFRFGLKKTQAYSLYVYAALVSYGATLSVLAGSEPIGFVNIERDVFVGLLGVLMISSYYSDRSIEKALVRSYVIYALIVTCLTVLLGGLLLQFPPAFRLEYIASSLGAKEEQTYSLGVSNFFGYATVAAALFVRSQQRRYLALLGFFCLVGFLFLSLLGGGRGESLAALVVVLILLSRRFAPILLAGGLILYWIAFEAEVLSALQGDFLFVKRLLILFEGNLSSRDFLLNQSYQLLVDNSQCLFVGCGFGFFQNYFGYEFEYYPHNLVAESVITFGLPLVLAAQAAVLIGILLHYRAAGKVDFILVFFAYALLVSLKSGYLLGSWVSLSFCCYFCALTLESISEKWSRSIG